MDRSRTLAQQVLAMAFAIALVGLTAACDSGTQEPDAPEAAAPEYGAPEAAPEPEVVEAVPPTPTDGTISPDRFPMELLDGITAEVPDNFPNDIPIYPGAEPAQGKGGEVKGSQNSGVQLLSNDSPGLIFGFYEDSLKSNGWQIDESRNDPMTGMINASKGSCKASMFFTVSPKGGTDIFIVTQC
jgi:hypothetical protein